jgi:tetratricopeptide (TPR) repeat protein
LPYISWRDCSSGWQNDIALDFITKAIAINPDYTEAHSNMGNVLQEFGKLDEAVASYNKALSIKPDYADAHSNLGTALGELGKLDEAVASYKQGSCHQA